MFFLASLFLVVSGIAALTYQVVWVRLLGLSLGSTSASVSTVLAAFFLGLAIGSYLAERITRNRINDLKVYIKLEAVIGISGLLLLPILLNLDNIMATIPELGSQIEFKFVVSMLLLVIPTMCMGATFPVMAAILVRKQLDMGKRVSQLYSLNTAGAVFGASMAGFVFVPNWGLDGAVYIAVSLNFLIVVLALYLNSRIELPPIEHGEDIRSALTENNKTPIRDQAPFRFHALLVLFCTGFVAIATEVGWTKYLSIFTGTTIYGFAAILTIFLTGIAVGSWWVKKHLDEIIKPEFWLALGLIVLGVSLLFTRAFLSTLPPIFEGVNHLSVDPWAKHGVKYSVVFLMLVLPTFVFGALFPLNLKLYCGNLSGVRARIGKAYAVNTLASIFGSIAAGFWIIPQFGTDVLLTVTALIILVLPFLFLTTLSKPAPRIVIASLASIAVASNWYFDHISYEKLIASVQYQYDYNAKTGQKPDVLFVKEGKTGVVSLVTYNGRHVRIQNNGLNESGFDLEQMDKPPIVEYLLGLVPYFLHDNPKSAFVVGYGGGFTTKAFTLTEELESIKVVELEPVILDAGKYIYNGEIPMLKDPRLILEFNDARNTLLLEDTKYDLIAAQPSHPWLSRASTVFTRDFFKVVKSRLNENGIYGQWLSMFNMDATTMRAIMKGFFEVFPEGFTMADVGSGDFLMFGSRHPLKFNLEKVSKRFSEEKIFKSMQYFDLSGPHDLLWYFALSRDQAMEAAGDIEPNTDLNILSEVRLSALDQNARGDESPYQLLWNNYTLDADYILKDVAAETYFKYARSLMKWNEFGTVNRIVTNLLPLDEVKSRTIEFEYARAIFDYDKALELYERQKEWLDVTHQQVAGIMMNLQRYDDALKIIERIKDEKAARVVRAKLLYFQKNFKKLADLKTKSDEEQMWQLSGLSKLNIKKAGAGLVALKDNVDFEETQLRIVIQYYSAIDDDANTQNAVRDLNIFTQQKIERMKKAIEIAISNKSSVRASTLLTRVEALRPLDDDILDLRKKIKALEKENKQV
ncbi:fused MFS/spermidine synthase [Kaarinaea lacus]